jgi:hypothetical protein
MANTLSVLLNFKTDLSGLTKFTDALTQRMALVNDLNAKLQGGANAVNSALQVAAGYFAVGALKDYAREAIGARQSQAALAQALKQTKQDSTAYRTELASQATALQQVTGLEDEQIAAVQRQLVFGKASRKDMADLTRLTLDFAAAKEIDVVSAAKAVGKALQGDGDELKRYGVEVDLAKGKVEALRDGLGKFAGQAGQKFGSLPEGMRDLQIASVEAKKSAGEAVLAIADPFLKGLADGIKAINGQLDTMAEHGSIVKDVLVGMSKAAGSFVGSNLNWLLTAAAGLLAIKAGSYLAAQGLAILSGGFMALTGTGLVPMLARLIPIVSRFGLLATIAAGGWPVALAAGIALVGSALAALAIGSVVINGITEAQLGRLDREQRIRDAIYDQTKSLNEQIAAMRNLADVSAAKKKAAADLEETRKQIKALEEAQTASANRPKIPGQHFSSKGFSEEEDAKLEALRFTEGLQARKVQMLDSPAFQQRVINENQKKTDAQTAADATKNFDSGANQKLQQELEIFDIETRILEAKDSGDTIEEANLTRLRDQLKLRQALVGVAGSDARTNTEAEKLSQQRLDAEQAARDKKLVDEKRASQLKVDDARQLADIDLSIREADDAGNTAEADRERREQRRLQLRRELIDASVDDAARIAEANQLIEDQLDLEDRLLQKERTRQNEERALETRLGEIADARALLENNRYLSAEQKRQASLILLRDENAALDARIAKLQEENKTASPEVVSQNAQRIEGYKRTRAGNLGTMEANGSQTIGQGIRQGMDGQGGFIDGIGTAAQNAANAVTSTLNSALQGTSDILYNLATGSMSFKQAWGAATLQVGQQFARMATDMVAKMIWKATVERGLIAICTALHIGGETAKTGATLTGGGIRLGVAIKEGLAAVYSGAVGAFKAMVSIPYVGPILGAIAMAAALAGGLALIGKIGHADGAIISGPGGSTDDRIPAMLSNGEAVTRASSVSKFGSSFFNRLNAGILDLSTLPGNVSRGMASPAYAAAGAGASGGGGGGSSQAAANGSDVKVFNAFFNDRPSAEQWLRSKDGKRNLIQMRGDLGQET